MFWVISVYFNIRNTLPKSGTFLLGHPVYIYICVCVCVCVCVSSLLQPHCEFAGAYHSVPTQQFLGIYLFICYVSSEFNYWGYMAKNGTRHYSHVSLLAVHNISLLARTIHCHQWRILWKYICQCDLVSGYDANMRNHFESLVNMVLDWIHTVYIKPECCSQNSEQTTLYNKEIVAWFRVGATDVSLIDWFLTGVQRNGRDQQHFVKRFVRKGEINTEKFL